MRSLHSAVQCMRSLYSAFYTVGIVHILRYRVYGYSNIVLALYVAPSFTDIPCGIDLSKWWISLYMNSAALFLWATRGFRQRLFCKDYCRLCTRHLLTFDLSSNCVIIPLKKGIMFFTYITRCVCLCVCVCVCLSSGLWRDGWTQQHDITWGDCPW